MARGAIPLNTFNRDGLDLSTVTPVTGNATDNHYVVNRAGMQLHIKNTNGASTARTVTFHIPGGKDGQTIVPRTETLAAGKEYIFGPFPVEVYGGEINIDVSHAEVTLRAFIPDQS